MSRHLLMVSVGPVADFISASRRTRDVHFSSWFVAEMGRAAAGVLAQKGELVFPADISRSDCPVSDRVLVWLKDGVDPVEATSAVRAAVIKVWREQAALVQKKHAAIGINQSIWDAQLNDPDLLELFSAWVVYDGKPDDGQEYIAARRRVEDLLNARETCTDFGPWTGPGAVPKNSLDGRRETVLNDSAQARRNRVARGIRENEQLDMPGVVKRLGDGGATRFVSVSRLAVDPYVRGCQANPRRKAVVDGVAATATQSTIKDLPFNRTQDPVFSDFPYDGQLLMENRLDSMIKREFNDDQAIVQALSSIRGIISGATEPYPYLAVLACDGDRMGSHSGIASMKTHQDFSRNLSSFAIKASDIVKAHHGSLVYAGGDDVLAFMPLDTAVRCADELNRQFGSFIPGGTLSVGIAVVHALTPMAGSMIRFAERAQALAKVSRNALAVTIHKRSGAPMSWVCSWDDDPAALVDKYASLFEDEVLPGKAAYNLRKLVEPYATGAPWVTADLVKAEVAGLLDKKKIPLAKRQQVVDDFTAIVGAADSRAVENVMHLADSLIVARMILAAQQQARGR